MKFERVPKDRFDEVIEHLRKSFFADEPLNKAVSLCRPGEGHQELEKHSLSTLRDGLSLIAVTDDNRIVGVALNGALGREDLERAQEALKNSTDDRYKKIFNFLYGGNVKSQIFDHLKVDKMFEIRILSVDPECRGQGIAKKLLEESERLAVAEGFRVMKADATGLFSQKICTSLGFTVHAEYPYESYMEDGLNEPVFKVDSPHYALKIMYKWIV